MRVDRLLAVAAIVVVGTTLGACTSAKSASTPTRPTSTQPRPNSQTTATSASSGNGAITRLTDYAANTDGPNSTVILTGTVGDYGTATYIHPDGTVDPEHTSQLKLTLTHGTLRLNLTAIHSNLVKAFTHFPTNATCSGTITAVGAAPIVTGAGTGAYAHARGQFILTATINEVDAKPTCDGTGTFLAQTILLTGSAPISLT